MCQDTKEEVYAVQNCYKCHCHETVYLGLRQSYWRAQAPQVKADLKELEKHVKVIVGRNKRLRYDEATQQRAKHGELHDCKALHKTLSQLGSKPSKMKSKAFPRLKQPDGRAVTTYLEQQRL